MATNSNQPDFMQILELWWGGAYECSGWAAWFAAASYVIVGTNPPYTLVDFLNLYPKFFGPATALQVTTVLGQNTATVTGGIPAGATLTAGLLLVGPGIPPGTVTTATGGTAGADLTMSNQATASATGAVVSTYLAPWLPLFALQLYINLATASLMQLRWLDGWLLAMGLFIAHYATLWLETEAASPNATAVQVATGGLQQGVIISQSAGDVSASTQPVPGLEDWGSLNLTQYGVQLATLAKVCGAGMMYIP